MKNCFVLLLAMASVFASAMSSPGRNRPDPKITELKTFYRDTTLVEDGRASSLIVYPDKPGYHELALEVADAIKTATGADVPVKTDKEYTETDRQTNLICLGRMNNNRLALDLYIWRYIASDDWFPGPDGFEFRTVSDPWGTGKNVVMLGGSDLDGVRRAAEKFKEMPAENKTLVIPYTIETYFTGMENLGQRRSGLSQKVSRPADNKEAPELMGGVEEKTFSLTEKSEESKWIEKHVERLRRSYRGSAGIREAGHLLECAEMYYVTGRIEYAEAWALMARDWINSYYALSRFRQMVWTDNMMGPFIRAFDLVEESPAIPDELKLELTNLIYDNVSRRSVHPGFSELGTAGRFAAPSWGGCDSVLYADDYFTKYYPAVDIEKIETGLQAVMTRHETLSRAGGFIERDGDNTPLRAGTHMKIALALGDYSYFETGAARDWMDYAISVVDPENRLFFSTQRNNIKSFPIAAWYYNDPGYMRFFNMLNGRTDYYPEMTDTRFHRWLWSYIPRIEPDTLSGHEGVYSAPLNRLNYSDIKYRLGKQVDFPAQRAFHHVVMREKFDGAGQYLRIGGVQDGIIEKWRGDGVLLMWDSGRLDGDQSTRGGPEGFSTALVKNEKQGATGIPALSDLQLVSNFRDAGFSRIVMHDYNDVDWARDIAWVKGKYWVFFDQFKARASGDYELCVRWYIGTRDRTPREDSLGRLITPTRVFHLAGNPTYSLPRLYYKRGWHGYLQETYQGVLDEDEQKIFVHLVYGHRGAEPPPYAVFRVDQSRVAVVEPDRNVLIGAAPLHFPEAPYRRPSEPLSVLPGIEAECVMFIVAPDELVFAGLTMLVANGVRLESDELLDLRVDTRTGSITAYAEAPAKIHVSGLTPTEAGGGDRFVLDAWDRKRIASFVPGPDAPFPDSALLAGIISDMFVVPDSEYGATSAIPEIKQTNKAELSDASLSNDEDEDDNGEHAELAESREDSPETIKNKKAVIAYQDVRGDSRNTPLHRAAYMGMLQAVRRLLENGVELDMRNDRGRTPLHLAAEMGHSEIVALLVEAGADIDARGTDGSTALHWAVYFAEGDETETVAFLVKAGADVNAAGGNGTTPFHLAAARGFKDIAELLIEYGADVNALDNHGRTPLDRTSAFTVDDPRTGGMDYSATREIIKKHGGSIRAASDAKIE